MQTVLSVGYLRDVIMGYDEIYKQIISIERWANESMLEFQFIRFRVMINPRPNDKSKFYVTWHTKNSVNLSERGRNESLQSLYVNLNLISFFSIAQTHTHVFSAGLNGFMCNLLEQIKWILPYSIISHGNEHLLTHTIGFSLMHTDLFFSLTFFYVWRVDPNS